MRIYEVGKHAVWESKKRLADNRAYTSDVCVHTIECKPDKLYMDAAICNLSHRQHAEQAGIPAVKQATTVSVMRAWSFPQS